MLCQVALATYCAQVPGVNGDFGASTPSNMQEMLKQRNQCNPSVMQVSSHQAAWPGEAVYCTGCQRTASGLLHQ